MKRFFFQLILLMLFQGILYGQKKTAGFSIKSNTGKPLKSIAVFFDHEQCADDSLAFSSSGSSFYRFNCFPKEMTKVHFTAAKHEPKHLYVDLQHLQKDVSISLHKKGKQLLKLDTATYKYWPLNNVLYLHPKEGKDFQLNQLIAQLQLEENDYYGKGFYEHIDRLDFTLEEHASFLKTLRKSDLAKVAAPVILLVKEKKAGERRFFPINKLFPVPNTIEFPKDFVPNKKLLNAFGFKEIKIYENQTAPGPIAYKSTNHQMGFDMLDVRRIIKADNPDLKVSFLNITKWYSLEFEEQAP